MDKIIIITTLALALPFSANALTVDTGAGVDASAGAGAASSTLQLDADADASILMQTDADTSASDSDTQRIVNVFEVETEADLSAYAETMVAGHDNVSRVQAEGDGEIVVEYRHPARLFGFIPVSITSRTIVRADAEGNADAETIFPWWSFFTIGLADAAADIESALEASSSIEAFVKASAEADASASVTAQATEVIITTLNASAGASLVVQ